MDRDRPTLTGLLDDVTFRYSSYDSPLWSRNNTVDGRWHVAGDGATQYMALSPDAAWAELARAEDLRDDDELALARMPIWVLRLSQQSLVDYSSFELAEAAGFPADALVDDEYARCQSEGRRLRDLGYAGVITPSAALPGAINVTLFGRRMLGAWGIRTKLASSIPGSVVAVGAPPSGLAARVRYFGSEHGGLTAYLEGNAERSRLNKFILDEPEAQRRRFGPADEADGTSGLS